MSLTAALRGGTGSCTFNKELTDIQLMVLGLIAQLQTTHAYAVFSALGSEIMGRPISSQSVYRSFSKLESDGLIESTGREEEASRGIEKVFYAITPLGKEVLECELKRKIAVVERAGGTSLLFARRA